MYAGVYCTPLHYNPINNYFKPHNLGLKYFEKANNFTTNYDKNKVKCIIIEVDNIEIETNIKGINYLKNGLEFLATYNEIKSQIDLDFINKFEKTVYNTINNSKQYLLNCKNNFLINKNTINYDNIDIFINEIENIKIFGFIYFEAFSIAIMLNQNNNCYYKNEINNRPYRDILFKLHPEFYTKFSLRTFKKDFKYLMKEIKTYNVITNYDDFFNDFFTIINQLLYDTLFFNINKNDLAKTTNFYTNQLFGHQVRLIQINPPHYNFFQNQFFIHLSKKLLNVLANKQIKILTNSIITKGELAIYPIDINNINVKFFSTEIIKEQNNTFLKKNKQLNIKFSNELINPNLITMNSYKNI